MSDFQLQWHDRRVPERRSSDFESPRTVFPVSHGFTIHPGPESVGREVLGRLDHPQVGSWGVRRNSEVDSSAVSNPSSLWPSTRTIAGWV